MKKQIAVLTVAWICLSVASPSSASGQDSFLYYPNGNLSSCTPGNFPFFCTETRFQVLVPVGALGTTPRQIKDIGVSAIFATQPFTMGHLQVRFAHTSQVSTLSPVFDNNLENDLTVCLEGSRTLVANIGKWTEVGLSRSFVYNGRENVVLEVRFKNIGGQCFVGCGDPNVIVQINRYAGYGATQSDGFSMYPNGMAKIRFRICEVFAFASSSTVRPGESLVFSLLARLDRNLPYQVGTSFGVGPIWFDSSPRRRISLSPDPLLALSIQNVLPSVFVGYSGVLNAYGRGSAALKIPNDQRLRGLTLHTAFITIDPRASFSIRSISNTTSVTVM